MAIEIRLPKLDESTTEADLLSWLVKSGDTVERGDVIAELETDKATVELEAPASGVMAEILVPEGTQAVEVGTLLARLEPVDEQVAAPSTAAAATAPAQPLSAQPTQRVETRQAPLPVQLVPTADATPVPVQPVPTSDAVPVTALARRMAAQAGLDLHSLHGSGTRGRVVKADVEAALPVASGPIETRSREAPPGAGSMILQLCAECEVDRLLELETSMNRVSLEVPVSLQGFLLMAVAHALREVPGANVGSDGAPIEAIDVAVTNGTSVAAIVKTADRKGLAALASELRDARAGQPAAVPEAAAVAVVAAGQLGGEDFESAYPPLLPGQCCALALGAPSQRPIVRQGAVEVATIAICTLTVDARCVDGEAAMKLLRAVKRRLEDPTEMIL